jgi:hypothetical protein
MGKKASKTMKSKISLDFMSFKNKEISVNLNPVLTEKAGKYSTKLGDISVTDSTQTHYPRSDLANWFGVSDQLLRKIIFCLHEDNCWPIDSTSAELG